MEQELEADSCFGTFLQTLVTAFLLSYSLFSFCFGVFWGFFHIPPNLCQTVLDYKCQGPV